MDGRTYTEVLDTTLPLPPKSNPAQGGRPGGPERCAATVHRGWDGGGKAIRGRGCGLMRVIRVSIVVSMLLVMLAVQTVTATHWTTRTVVDKSVAQECVGGTKIEAPAERRRLHRLLRRRAGNDHVHAQRNPGFRHGRPEPRHHVPPHRGRTDQRHPLHLGGRYRLGLRFDGTLQPQQRQAVRLQPHLHLHCEEVVSRTGPRCPR